MSKFEEWFKQSGLPDDCWDACWRTWNAGVACGYELGQGEAASVKRAGHDAD